MLCTHITALLLLTRLPLIIGFCTEDNEDYNLLISSNSSYPTKSFVYNGTINECDCGSKTCIRKCCDVNYVYVNKTCVYNGQETKFSIFDSDKKEVVDNLNIQVISGFINCKGATYYMLEPEEEPDDEFFLQTNGKLWHPSENVNYALDSYCIDNIDGQLSALICFPQKGPNNTINIAGMVISMPFLLATFLIYALLPNLNIHGKSLMCYVFSLLLAYIFLTLINTIPFSGASCTAVALLCLYFFIASFFWMNVMSVDIWTTFSGKRQALGNTKEIARRKFLMYSCYAWGASFVLISIIASFNFICEDEVWYNPNIGYNFCWFRNNISDLLYFYGPMGLIIILNLSLFGVTALRIRKLQKDTEILRTGQFTKHSDDDHKRFKLYIRLSLAMGVNWIMEIVSWAVNWQIGSVPPSVWYLTDFCNAVYGVIIFFIFAFKKKIWRTLRERYPCGSSQTFKIESNVTNA